MIGRAEARAITPKMNRRFARCFAALRARREGAFVPFLTLGDPNPEQCARLLQTLAEAGADALELGLPFSDPCADGPVIQKADKRALAHGRTTADFFRLVAGVRARNPDLPISLLVYANLVVARGPARFYADAAACGTDAVLVADVPYHLLRAGTLDLLRCAHDAGISPVLIAPPNASDTDLEHIAAISDGYVYVLSRYGITGTDKASGRPQRVIAKLRELRAAPLLLGFGISNPSQIKDALSAGVDGAITGSGVVKLIEQHVREPDAMLTAVGDYVRQMKAATVPHATV